LLKCLEGGAGMLTCCPSAQFCLSALGLEVFRHLTRTRGCKHKRVQPPVFFDATAEYHRSDESSVPCAVPVSAGACAGQNTERFRGRLRIRLSGLHPRVGPEEVERHIASKLATGRATGAGSPNAFHSHYGPVLGLGPLSSQPCGWGTVERAAPSFVTSPASRRGDARSS
jgi:hypothetical protein